MVLLHTCGGVSAHITGGAEWLKTQGYVALVVDGLVPRGVIGCSYDASSALLISRRDASAPAS